MSFLFPAMLMGLAGLAVPVVLHLIARNRFPVRDFPSIRLLRFERLNNVFAWTLLDRRQLLLRLLVLMLLVLAMARLFAPWLSSRPAPHNLAVVLDASASMRMQVVDPQSGGKTTVMDLAQRRADAMLRDLAAPSLSAVISAGDEIRLVNPLLPEPSLAIEALETVRAGDGTGPGMVRAIADGCKLLQGRREIRCQVAVLSDLRASAFESRHQDDLRRIGEARADLGAALDIVFVDLGGESTTNVAILDARVRGGTVRVGDDAHVIARVLNSGTVERQAKLRMAMGGRTEPLVKAIALPPAGEAIVDLTAPISRSLRTFVEVRLEEPDAMAFDDRSLAPVNVADACRVLIVRGAEPVSESATALGQLGGGREVGTAEPAPVMDGATILRYALNPGRELGAAYSTGIETGMASPDTLSSQPLSRYDVVILYDVSSLPDKALQDLDTFARSGKALLFFCSAGCNAVKFNRSLAAGAEGRSALSPARIGNDRELTQPLGLALDATRHPVLAPFRDRLQGDLSALRFSRTREIQGLADGATVMFRSDDGAPLAVEGRVGQGRTVLMAFGVELDRGNVARMRAFPVMMWRLARYVSGRLSERRADILSAAVPAVLDVSEPTFAFENEIEMEPAQGASVEGSASAVEGRLRRMAISPDRAILVQGLPAGAYMLHKPRVERTDPVSYERPVAVNTDPRESRTERIGEADLQALFGPGVRVLRPGGSGDEPAPRGGELWPWFIALLALAYAAEAWVGFLTNLKRERERKLAGGGVA